VRILGCNLGQCANGVADGGLDVIVATTAVVGPTRHGPRSIFFHVDQVDARGDRYIAVHLDVHDAKVAIGVVVGETVGKRDVGIMNRDGHVFNGSLKLAHR